MLLNENVGGAARDREAYMILTLRPGCRGQNGVWTTTGDSLSAMKLRDHILATELMPDDQKSGEATVASTLAAKKPTTAAERKRKWHTKTRNGCKTCKKRRVRCDETKPACLRCLSLNKVCEGYDAPQVWLFEPRRNSTGGMPSRGLSRPETSPEESRALQFFHENTKPALMNFSSAADHFWRFVVPQMSHQQETIRHQVIATGSIHEYSLGVGSSSVNPEYLANRHYGKALHELATVSAPPTHVVLMSCLLFIAMETVRTRSETSLIHLQSGLQILREWKQSKSMLPGQTPSAIDELIELWIEPIFVQLEAAASMTEMAGVSPIITPPEQLAWRTPHLPDSFSDLLKAREKFAELGHWLYFQTLRDPFCQTAGNLRLQEIMEVWTEWYQKFLSLWKVLPQDDTREQLRARLLDVHYRSHLVTLQAQALPMETVWDDYLEEHKRHVDTCASILENVEAYSASKDPLRPDFDFEFDPGILPPMWQVAMDCRDSQTRHRALELIRIHHRKCGHEDDCSAAVMAESIIHMEEAGLVDPASSTCNDIPEHKRVRQLECDISELGKMVLTYARPPYTIREATVVPFFTLSNPPILPFKIWPLAETMRLAGYQGLLRPRAQGCRCKSCGAT